jgi:hypothetical protein
LLALETHILQFYFSEDFLCRSIAEYFATGLRSGDALLMIATLLRYEKIAEAMRGMGHDPASIVFLDVERLLQPAAGGLQTEPGLHDFTTAIRRALEGVGSPARVYGELADQLISRGESATALQVEDFWNFIGKTHRFSITCAHALENFWEDSDGRLLHEICRRHGRSEPAG